MDRARRQFLARPAFAGNQNSGIGHRDFRNQVIDLLHRFAFADHVVLKIGVGDQLLVLGLQIPDVPDILNRHRGDGRDRRNQLQMVFVKSYVRHVRVEIDNPERLSMDDQRHAQERTRMRGNQALGLQRLGVFGVSDKHRGVVLQHAPHNGAAYRDLLVWPVDAIQSEYGGELAGKICVIAK